MAGHHLELHFRTWNTGERTSCHHKCQGAEAGIEYITMLYSESVVWIRYLQSLHATHLQPAEEAGREENKSYQSFQSLLLALSPGGQLECWAFLVSIFCIPSHILQMSELKTLVRTLSTVSFCQCQPCILPGARGVSARDSEKISHELCIHGKLSIRYVCSPLSKGNAHASL